MCAHWIQHNLTQAQKDFLPNHSAKWYKENLKNMSDIARDAETWIYSY